MNQPTKSSADSSSRGLDRLETDDGKISVAESVVQKIAGKACREVSGVHAMGTSSTRTFGAIIERIPRVIRLSGHVPGRTRLPERVDADGVLVGHSGRERLANLRLP